MHVGDFTIIWLQYGNIMTIVDFPCMAVDGYVYGQSSVYSGSHSTSAGFDSISNYAYVGQTYIAPNYYCMRGYLKFNTTTLSAAATILQANIIMVCTIDDSAVDFDLDIIKYDWSSYDPVAAGNRETVYDGILAGTKDVTWRNSSGISLNTQYTSPDLDTAWINPGGYTYYALRSSRDFSTSTPSGGERIAVATQDNATSSYRPVLRISYSIGRVSIPIMWM